MGFCTNCGHELGGGRFCTSCGHPIDVSTARYPLFADEVDATRAAPEALPPVPATAPPPVPAPVPSPAMATASFPAATPSPVPAPQRPRRPWWPWALGGPVLVLVVVLVVALGVGLVSGLGDSGTEGRSDDTASGAESSTGGADPGEGATVEVPATAPPNQDTAGNPTTYDAANLLDGVPTTSWRMPGDGTGEELTVTFADETRLSRVGLINGYAKTAQDAQGRELDWYHGNRRVLSVEWEFDDGTTVAQELDDTVEVQSVDVDVETTSVVLRLVSVSSPGSGPASRDFTAISDLSFAGGR
ncbi:MAG: hypothetical protein WBP61_15550 [Nocardioides sp.]